MLYARIDVGLPRDARILRAGPMAKLLYIQGILLAKEMLTDGAIPREALGACAIGVDGNPMKLAARLVELGLWEATTDGWRVPPEKWGRYQITAQQVRQQRAKTAERVANHRERNAGRNGVTESVTDGVTPGVTGSVSSAVTLSSERRAQSSERRDPDAAAQQENPPVAAQRSPPPGGGPGSPASAEPQAGPPEPEANGQGPGRRRRAAGSVARDDAASVPLPAALEYSAEFRAAWAEWLAYRSQDKRKRVTMRSAAMQLRRLDQMGPKRAVLAIESSIANGWQGLFNSDESGPGIGPRKHVEF